MKINEAVRQMHPPRYTVSQAAELVGKDADTLRRWSKSGLHRASDAHQFGKIRVPLYTNGDIEDMREIAKNIRPGRKSA